MEELSPPISVALNLVNPIIENPSISSNTDVTRLKLDAESSTLVSVPALVLDNNPSTSHDTCHNHVNPVITEVATSLMLGTADVIEDTPLFNDAHHCEEDEVLSVSEDTCLLSGVELLPLDATSDLLRLPLDAPETSLPIAVEIEGTESGQIVAKVISLEESASPLSSQPNEESSSEPRIKASVVSVQLPSEKNESSSKGSVKSVFELDCLPLWGSESVCGHRPEMEDSLMAVPHFAKIPIKMFVGDHFTAGISQTLTHLTSHFFGVYDGHGGSQVANYCRDRIHLALLEELKNVKDTPPLNGVTIDTRQAQWERVFRACFLKVDDEVSGKVSRSVDEENAPLDAAQICTVQTIAPETVGSTAVVAVVCSSHIIVANCGDSRAVLYRGKEAMALSIDHKPDREDEYARIVASDGKVIQWNGHRVFGVLAMSRAIGDRYLKPWIIPEPEVTFMPRAREDECLILATDGLWDVMTNEEVCEIARKRILIWHKKNGGNPLIDRGQGIDQAAQSAAEYLSNLALQRGSKDNISIIVVDLKAQRKFKSKS